MRKNSVALATSILLPRPADLDNKQNSTDRNLKLESNLIESSQLRLRMMTEEHGGIPNKLAN